LDYPGSDCAATLSFSVEARKPPNHREAECRQWVEADPSLAAGMGRKLTLMGFGGLQFSFSNQACCVVS
jgi:hypothetical protein